MTAARATSPRRSFGMAARPSPRAINSPHCPRPIAMRCSPSSTRYEDENQSAPFDCCGTSCREPVRCAGGGGPRGDRARLAHASDPPWLRRVRRRRGCSPRKSCDPLPAAFGGGAEGSQGCLRRHGSGVEQGGDHPLRPCHCKTIVSSACSFGPIPRASVSSRSRTPSPSKR